MGAVLPRGRTTSRRQVQACEWLCEGSPMAKSRANEQKLDIRPVDRMSLLYVTKSNLVVSKDGVAYEDWFLPSRDELDLVYEVQYKNNIRGFSGGSYWSSSENLAQYAWNQNFGNGTQGSGRRQACSSK